MRCAFILIAAALMLSACCGRNSPAEVAVIPQPQVVETGMSTVVLRAGEYDVVRSLDSTMRASSYSLDIDKKGVRICAGDEAGLFYAEQTLRQLVPADSAEAGIRVPGHDAGRGAPFLQRGRREDRAGYHGIAQAELFPLASDRRPGLAPGNQCLSAAYEGRVNASPHHHRKDPNGEYDENTPFDETPYGGYYTQDQVREIVEYAAQRHITVVPEIEFPGHAVAALASYPWLSCTGEQYRVRETWDIDDRVYCIGKESTFRFMENVLSEVIDLFPSPYIHIGGDECPDKMWQKCPSCANRMKAEGLETYRQLQGYGVKRLEKFLSEHGRSIIGWDEILEAGVESSAIVMSWRGAQSGIKAAQSGNHVIMSPTDYSYFDYYQFDSTVVQPLAWGGYIPLEKVYSFDPYAGLETEQRKLVLGIQANLWSEYIPSLSQLEYMMLPRLAALSETAWSPSKKNINRFLTDCKRFERLYGSLGYNYAKSAENED